MQHPLSSYNLHPQLWNQRPNHRQNVWVSVLYREVVCVTIRRKKKPHLENGSIDCRLISDLELQDMPELAGRACTCIKAREGEDLHYDRRQTSGGRLCFSRVNLGDSPDFSFLFLKSPLRSQIVAQLRSNFGWRGWAEARLKFRLSSFLFLL